MKILGVCHDAGVVKDIPGARPSTRGPRGAMEIIRRDLHCTAIRVVARDVGRLELAREAALEADLDVPLWPRCGTRTRRDSHPLRRHSQEVRAHARVRGRGDRMRSLGRWRCEMDEAPVEVRVNPFGSSQQTVTISLSPAGQPAPATGRNPVARPHRQAPVPLVSIEPASRPIRLRGLIVAIVALFTAAGCASANSSIPPQASPTAPAASANPSIALLASPTAPGSRTETSTGFQPQITYTLPAGWTDDVDEPAEWRILPPGSTHDGAENGTSDAIAIHVRIAASAADCSGVPQPGVGQTPTAIATYWAHLPGLTTTAPKPVTVGGLSGVVLDISMSKTWTKPCPYSGGAPTVPLIVGLTNTNLDHPIGAGPSIRAYLLGLNGGTLAIEVQDVTGGSHFAEYAAIIQMIHFKP